MLLVYDQISTYRIKYIVKYLLSNQLRSEKNITDFSLWWLMHQLLAGFAKNAKEAMQLGCHDTCVHSLVTRSKLVVFLLLTNSVMFVIEFLSKTGIPMNQRGDGGDKSDW